jgi:lipopolysaccharide transport system ATP-binding protein
MSQDNIIQFKEVSKRYRIHYQGLRHWIQNLSKGIGFAAKAGFLNKEAQDYIWAVKDVSFAVNRGEALGIIGPNGAGKTTILKILSGITAQDSGEVRVRGRIGALIELGAGFHPELTGRENIYLNGTILGLKKKEIDEKFDSIVNFAELEKFIDTPVKKYSSGMYLRLGFSVAAHIKCDVLLIDEILSVGDINFQNKSIKKMLAFKNKDVAIVFVSHNLSSVSALCDRAIYLKEGRIQESGPTGDVISRYLGDFDKQREASAQGQSKFEPIEIPQLSISKVVLLNSQGQESQDFRYKDDITVRVFFEAKEKVAPYFMVYVSGCFGTLFGANMLFDCRRQGLEGEGFFDCIFKSVSILPGNYHIELGARGEDGVCHIISPRIVASFNIISPVEEYGFKGEFALAESRNSTQVVLPYEWKFYDK